MQVLREFPSDKEFSAILRADVLCSHRIVANGDIFEVSGRTIPGWLVAISFGVVAVVAIVAPFYCTFGAVLGVIVWFTLPVAATFVWLAGPRALSTPGLLARVGHGGTSASHHNQQVRPSALGELCGRRRRE